MEKIRVLGIAPYEGMLNLMRAAAEKRDDISLTAFVGDLDSGVAIASRYTNDDFDVILSRGGTAEMIRQKSKIPIVEIPISAYDILRSINLAKIGKGKYAIVGFPAITRNARFLCDILQYHLDIFTINNEQEARTLISKLSKEGYSMVMCDMIANSTAQRFGLPAMLINSGAESVEDAMDQSVKTSMIYHQLQDRARFFQGIAQAQPQQLLVLNSQGGQEYATSMELLPQKVTERILNTHPYIVAEGHKRFVCEVNGRYYSINGKTAEINGETYVVYALSTLKTVLSLQKYGIYLVDKEEAIDRFFNSFYGITRSTSAEGIDVEQYAQSREAIFVTGEFGTGKDQMVRLLYSHSSLSHSPLVVIDCAQLHSRGWNFLIENKYSPLTDTEITIHIRNINALTDKQFLELFMMVKDMHTHHRNRLIFCGTTDGESTSGERARSIIEWFSCLVVNMPSLRSNKEMIPHLASLYISTLNMKYSKEIIGVEPEGLRYLESYDWPNNYDQFKRVINELVLATDESFIKAESIYRILKREIRTFGEKKSDISTVSDDITLEDMNLMMLKQVLAQEHGNQTTAAKRLGISRTTLWRMLQKCVDESIVNKEDTAKQ
ncbi:MAG TPA: PrpR N-terminal domain-containing protein [Candidatus Limiplasma sp.]|nr:PrpR N-terminal domain-containing protein [Candidatus Limiplasma sp.]